MRIFKVSIGQFGKIKQRELEFHEGLNIVYGKNESGKSTLLAFVTAMFYGFTSNKKNIRDNRRKRYMPWGDSRAEGELYLQDEQVLYRIKRLFGTKKSQDKLEILNADSGENILLEPLMTPGKFLLGVEVYTYEKTALITQLCSEINQSNNDEIVRYLTNLQGTGDASISYDKAKKGLEEYKKTMVNTEKKPGVLDKLKLEYDFQLERINGLKRQKEVFDEESINERMDLNDAVQRLLMGNDDFIEQIENIKSMIMHYKDVDITLKKKTVENKHRTQELNIEGFETDMMDDIKAQEDLNKIIEESVRKENYQEKIKIYQLIYDEIKGLKQDNENSILAKEIKKLEYSIKEIKRILVNRQRLQHQLKDVYNESELKIMNKKKKWMFALALLSMVIMAVTTMIELLPVIAKAIMLVPFIFCVYKGICINKRLNEKNVMKQRILNAIKKIEEELERFLNQHNVNNVDQLYEKVEKYKIKYGNIDTIIEEKEKMLNEYDQKKYYDLIAKSEFLTSKLLKKYDCKNQEALKEKIINHQKAKEKYSRMDEALQLSLKEEAGFISKRHHLYQDILEEMNRLYGQMISCCQYNLDELREKINKYEKEVAAMDMAIKAIDDAFVQFHRAFSKSLNDEAKKILKSITSKNYNQVLVSKDFEVKIADEDIKEIKSIDYFSNGTWDQVYFSVRMAIAKIMSKKINAKLPLLLDDAFVQYDEKRIEAVLEYVYEYSKNYQVILFTCQKREVEYLKKYNDVHIINI